MGTKFLFIWSGCSLKCIINLWCLYAPRLHCILYCQLTLHWSASKMCYTSTRANTDVYKRRHNHVRLLWYGSDGSMQFFFEKKVVCNCSDRQTKRFFYIVQTKRFDFSLSGRHCATLQSYAHSVHTAGFSYAQWTCIYVHRQPLRINSNGSQKARKQLLSSAPGNRDRSSRAALIFRSRKSWS